MVFDLFVCYLVVAFLFGFGLGCGWVWRFLIWWFVGVLLGVVCWVGLVFVGGLVWFWWQLGCLLFICSVVLMDCVLGYIRWVRLWLPRVLGVLLVAICVLGVVAGCAWWTVWICLLVLVLDIVFVGFGGFVFVCDVFGL